MITKPRLIFMEIIQRIWFPKGKVKKREENLHTP